MAVLDYTVTADKSQHLFGWLNLVRGTWTADGETSGKIVTGLSEVRAHGVSVDTGTVTSQLMDKPNVTGAGVAENGSIGILACQTDNAGTWWALGPI